MDNWQGQDYLWNSFGIKAYDENTVDDKAEMPYITYEAVDGSLGGSMLVSASLWYKGGSWAEISKKANQMKIGLNRQVKIDGGYIKVRTPFANYATRMNDPNDKDIRRIRIAVEMEFLTN
jgi:hypothetical protein